jgi:hypothetical protein
VGNEEKAAKSRSDILVGDDHHGDKNVSDWRNAESPGMAPLV